MPLATLSIDLEARLATLEEGLSKAARINEKFAGDVAARWEQAGSAVRSALGIAIGGITAGAFASMARGLLDSVDALNDVSDATGASIESISALEDIALRTGTTLGTVETALVKLNAVLNEAKPDSATELTLKGIGLSAAELRKMDPAEALHKLATALAGYADDGNKARLIQDLLGKSAKDLAPFIKDLSEVSALHGKNTKEQADQADALNKRLFEMEASSQAAKKAILVELLPTFNRLAGELADGLKHYKSFWDYVIDVGTTNPFVSINETLTSTATRLRKIGEEMEAIKARQRDGGLFATLNKGADEEHLKRLQKEQVLLKQRQAFFQARQVAEAGPVGGGRGVGSADRPSVPEPQGDGTRGKGNKGDKATVSDYDRYIQQLETARQRLEELTQVEQTAADIERGRLGDINQAQAERALYLAREIDDKRAAERAERELAQATEEAARAQQRMRDDAQRLWEAVQTPAEKYAAELENIKRLTEAGAFGNPKDAEVAERIARVRQGALDRLTDAGKKSTEDLSEFAKQAQRNIQDALGDTVLSALKGDFDSIGKMWLDLLIRMQAQAAAAQLNEFLFGKSGTGGSGWLSTAIGLAASFFGSGTPAGSGITLDGVSATAGAASDFSLAGSGAKFGDTAGSSDLFGLYGSGAKFGSATSGLPGRATGGPVEAGTAYMVGEAGPEVAVFGKSGTVLPSNITSQLMRAGSGSVQWSGDINLQVGEFVTPSQARMLAEQTRQAAIAGVAEAMRRGRL